MPNSSKRQKEPGLEDELRKMILGNVRVHDEQPRGSIITEQQNRTRSPREESPRGVPAAATNDHHHRPGEPRAAPDATTAKLNRNGPALKHQKTAEYRGSNDRRQGFRPPASRSTPEKGYERNPNDGEAYARPAPRSRQLFQPNPRPGPRAPPPAIFIAQCEYLDQLATKQIAQSQMSYEEYSAKETYRDTLERGFRQTLLQIGLPGHDILALRGFGSFSSGFATANSDVDLAVVLTPLPIQTAEQFALITKEMPRLLEKVLLDAGFGARLLDRTRVPIIKTCQAPTPELLDALRDERRKWDELPEEEKYEPKARKETDELAASDAGTGPAGTGPAGWQWKGAPSELVAETVANNAPVQARHGDVPAPYDAHDQKNSDVSASSKTASDNTAPLPDETADAKTPQRTKQKTWLRERPPGPLDFPKEGVGIQADINFSNALALHNTDLLRCYSLCDSRVQPMVLFVKSWAKRRKINSSYNGTLSSYGYVLMVLHFLVNIVQPPVLPNLQLREALMPQGSRTDTLQWQPLPDDGIVCDGYHVNFWRNAELIKTLASRGALTQNQEPLGVLLRNFFHHYAHQGNMVIGRGFQWTSEVLSLRTRGGLLTKEEKGWTGAKTTTTENREVRHRYLFAIEDPFELDHNVARTVTHHGIVAIRDEFRRAWRILMDVGNGREPQPGHLFDPVVDAQPQTDKEPRQQADGAAVQPA